MSGIEIINPYQEGLIKKIKDFIKFVLIKTRSIVFLTDIAANHYASALPKMPLTIEVETVNRCNSDCSFCPINYNNDPRPYQKMQMELIEKIANDLANINYDGILGLHSNNEPLTDRRIVEICALFRKKVPLAYINIWTNGIMLNYELYVQLFDTGLDELLIDNYDDGLHLIKSVAKLLEEIEKNNNPHLKEYKRKTRIILRKKNEILTNRGGIAPNKPVEVFKEYNIYETHSCAYPFTQMVIRPSGEVSLCCQDAFGQVTLGDLKTESILDIWHGEKFEGVRMALQQHGRKEIKLCSKCDVGIVFGKVWGLHFKTLSMKRKAKGEKLKINAKTYQNN